MSQKLLVYKIAKFMGAFAICRVVTRSRVRIVCYHGASLGDESSYNPLLFMSATLFRSRIEWLIRKKFSFVPLDHAVDIIEGRKPARRLPTIITFDDGWYSTAAKLVPVLAEHKIPSTLYLCTSHFLEGWPVVSVVVNYLIWKVGLQQIKVEGIHGAVDGCYRLDDRESRDAFHRNVCEWLVSSPANRDSVDARIARLAGLLGMGSTDVAIETRRFSYVSTDEVRALNENGCIVELHGHVHSYPLGDPQAFGADLAACRDTIMALGLPQPHHYCYPSGAFDDNAAPVLAEHGISTATTCIPGLVGRKRQLSWSYFLPRFLDGDGIDMLVFEAEMSGFASFVRWLFRR